ncbi:aminotransferase-like domain-containing protein [Pseudonocardia abyssalis]|uniref:PLP-dependent aminotransferase family protein n=1 Tax=Pseudonocardia abyssalis TaxID=2792008 RepID=A0ABS6UKP6_9PSEU|nr:PLP-dependent aminotransferase family protein [Pseudonocardia abyssalis]MBW0117380.1 PLP-dependent aminotransferase family protein [Pseudonocardia abyssalis]MBW0132798.1 PLP-dependent aminotransferase family protein [Pseudonocardia abyssalis]
MDDYRSLADALAADVDAGRLRPGERLPTQRRFARDRGIAVSTASRVYAELVRRGIAVGEVGRGTFVRVGDPGPDLPDPADGRVDLELNFPVVDGQAEILARALGPLLRPDALTAALAPTGVTGTPAARAAAAATFARPGWSPDPDAIRFAGNGRQAIAAAVGALVGVGGRLGVEALTYPVVRGIAARLGVQLVALPVDDDGLVPDGVRDAGPLDAVYVQPTLHNPLGTTMPPARRAELAAVLRERDLPCIEDTIYAFLRDGPPPLVTWAPERTVVVDGLSKRLAPGLSVGIVVPPPEWAGRVSAALRSGGWTATGFALDATARAMASGAVAEIEAAKRVDAAARQSLVRQSLVRQSLVHQRLTVRADPAAYHCWWELPAPWRAETFVAAAARLRIAVTPAAAFAVGTAHAPNAVRLALAAPPLPVLARALDRLAALARSNPGDDGVE